MHANLQGSQNTKFNFKKCLYIYIKTYVYLMCSVFSNLNENKTSIFESPYVICYKGNIVRI